MSKLGNAILVIEDNEDDIYALRRACRKANITHPLKFVSDGQEAVYYLAGEGPYSDRAEYPLPFLIFLDLKLPYRDGFGILKWIQGHAVLHSIVVAVLTGSDETVDHQKARALGVRAYLVKPIEAETIRRLMDSLESIRDGSCVILRDGSGMEKFDMV